MELIEDLERRGHVFVIRPQVPVVKNTEDDRQVLTAFYLHGYEYAKEIFPMVTSFVAGEKTRLLKG